MEYEDFSTSDENFIEELELDSTTIDTDLPMYVKEIAETEDTGMENESDLGITTGKLGPPPENENTSTEENLHIFPKMFGISFVTGAIILSIIALICVIKQFCCKKVAKNYAYRKLS